MATTQNRENTEAEVWNAIAAFEKILEAIPDDRSSLETLFHAYEHIGDRARALEYLLRLSEIVAAEHDAETAAYIIEKLDEYGASDDRIARQQQILRSLAAEVEEAMAAAERASVAAGREETTDVPEPAPAPALAAVSAETAPVRFRVADELSFAWRLFEAGEITQEEYASVAHDLAELSIDGHLSTVSVLHALEGRAFSGMERVMGYVSRESKTPMVSLQSFELQPATSTLLPKTFVIRRGAVVFDLLKEDALVAVMNPFDRTLRSDVEKATGLTCHFFMALPRDFDAVVASLPDDGR